MISITYTSKIKDDIFTKTIQNSETELFFDPCVFKDKINTEHTLKKLCDWANDKIQHQGLDMFLSDHYNNYDIANLVKINLWTLDIQKQGVVKPFLLKYIGNGRYIANTGETRLRSMEQILNLNTVRAFVVVPKKYVPEFDHLERIMDIHEFARYCAAVDGQQFLFDFTTDQYNNQELWWFEYDSQRTAAVTPGDEWCIEVFKKFTNNKGIPYFTPQWFLEDHNWNRYKNW